MLDFITWTARPTIIEGPVTIRWYGLMFAIGFLFGYWVLYKIFKREGAREEWLSSLFVTVVLATIIGARLGHVFFYDWEYYSQHLGEIFKIWEGGLASHGGVLAILLALLAYSRWVLHRGPLWILDRIIVPVGVVAALIRIGNLMNHEIYGGPTDVSWAFCFVTNVGQWMQGMQPIFSVPSHPTQLYEAACYLLTFAVCWWLYWKRNAQERPGLLFGVFMIGIFVSRFFIEYLKNVQEPWEIGMRQQWGIDQGQLLSIPFILLGVILVVRALMRPRVPVPLPGEFSDKNENNKKK